MPEQEGKRVKEQETPKFPAIGLVVSGGHTDLVLMKNHQQIKWLGGTRDDAAGECFDKCARLLGLGYPGGPAISEAAKKLENGNSKLEIRLPRPMMNEDNFDFSFSGLKTAVLRGVQDKLSEDKKSELAYEIQEAITDVLVAKTKKAVEKYKVKSILLAGGVTANPRLREKFKLSILDSKLFIPAPSLCTDNATFIASCAYFNFHPVPWQKLQANSSLEIEEMIK
jgi:N6-L-threonylcarbamoyladenine synthase